MFLKEYIVIDLIMEIKEFKIYEFHELDITTQRKVIDGFIADGIFDEDCDYLEDEYVNKLSSFGIDDVDEDEFRILDDMVYKFIEKYKYRILEWLYGIANEFYDKCRDEYIYQISDRYIIDMIESNEYRFFEDGRVVI